MSWVTPGVEEDCRVCDAIGHTPCHILPPGATERYSYSRRYTALPRENGPIPDPVSFRTVDGSAQSVTHCLKPPMCA